MQHEIPASLSRDQMQRLEQVLSPYVDETHLDDAQQDIISTTERLLQEQFASKKNWLKAARAIDTPEFCDCLIVELEKRRRMLTPGYETEQPRG